MVPVADRTRLPRMGPMDAHHQLLLMQLVSMAGLIGATIEYCEILKRRAGLRLEHAQDLELEAAGLQKLVRLFVMEAGPRTPFRRPGTPRSRRRGGQRSHL